MIIQYIHYFDDVICIEPSFIICNPKETYQAYVQTTKLSLYEMQRKIEQIERIAAAEQKKTAAEQKIAMELIGKLQKQVHQLSERFDTPETDMSKADMSGKKRRLK